MGERHKNGERLGIQGQVFGYASGLEVWEGNDKSKPCVTLQVRVPLADGKSQFVDCKSWQADAMADLRKVQPRSLVRVWGPFKIRSWTDKMGVQQTRLEIWVDGLVVDEVYAPSGAVATEVPPETDDLPF